VTILICWSVFPRGNLLIHLKDFGKLRDKSVKIGKHRALLIYKGCITENLGCSLLAVVIMTTANEMYPGFSGRYLRILFFKKTFSIFNRVATEFAGVHTDIARSLLA